MLDGVAEQGLTRLASLLALPVEPRQHLGKRGQRDQAGESPGDGQQPLDEIAVDHADPRLGLGLARARRGHDVRLNDHAHQAENRHRDHEPGVAFLRASGGRDREERRAELRVQPREPAHQAQPRGNQEQRESNDHEALKKVGVGRRHQPAGHDIS